MDLVYCALSQWRGLGQQDSRCSQWRGLGQQERERGGEREGGESERGGKRERGRERGGGERERARERAREREDHFLSNLYVHGVEVYLPAIRVDLAYCPVLSSRPVPCGCV